MTTETVFRPKSHHVQRLEAEYAKPIRDILHELFEELGTREEVALRLRISYSTLLSWMERYDVRVQRRLTPIL